MNLFLFFKFPTFECYPIVLGYGSEFYCYFLITEPVAQVYLFYLLSFWHR
jgi:hypothetical protein